MFSVKGLRGNNANCDFGFNLADLNYTELESERKLKNKTSTPQSSPITLFIKSNNTDTLTCELVLLASLKLR